MVTNGIDTKHADAGAAIESAENKSTILLGKDTDLLVLLLHHAELKLHPLIFKTTMFPSSIHTYQFGMSLRQNLCLVLNWVAYCH